MIYNSDPGNAPYDDYTEGVSEKGQNRVLAFMDTLSGMLREMFPRCPRFMTDSLWGYIPGVLLAMFFISMWEFSDAHNSRVLELNQTVMSSFRSMDDVRDRLGDDYYWHYAEGDFETFVYSYADRLPAITSQEFDCFARKYRKRIKREIVPGKYNKSPTRMSAWAKKTATVRENSADGGLTKKDLRGEITVSRVRSNSGPDSVSRIRSSWISDIMKVDLTPEETDRFTSETYLRITMFQGCSYDDYFNDD
ncbi:hypothetical protein [Succinimonas amylolytica]|uniref:hypothetical protein n=1 Tax=Succinimonas amylolytica TaxID=83769 RepID=UPI000378DA11|nr:hypothetical protein [Succinimonas amylolytica]